jgi:hypothetical protein
MVQGNARNLRKEAHWRQLLQRWQHSGLSVRAFCRRERCSEPSFYSWRRILAERDQRAIPSTPAAAVTFVPLHVQHEPAAERPALELLLANGRCLRIPAGWPLPGLRDLLAVLEGQPC